MRRSRRRVLPSSGAAVTFVVAGFVVVVVLLLGLSPSLNPIALLSGHGFDVEVPAVGDLTQTRALLTLERSRLRGRVDFAYSSSVPRGLVMGQRPRGGTDLRRDSVVRLVVSRGPSRVVVPALAGVPESQAKRDLERLGLEVKVDRRPDEVVPKGQVVRQDPPAETVLSGGDTVHVVVSQGPLIRSVPDLAGVAVEGAMFTLGRAGLALGTVSQADDAAVPTGAVIGTNPPAGTLIDRDSPVDVVVSNGPPPVAVPSVVGGTQTNAVDQLTRLGLVVGEVSAFGIPDDPAAGTVLEQLPPAGTLLRLGEVVTLTIRRAAIPTTTTAPPAPVPPTPGGG